MIDLKMQMLLSSKIHDAGRLSRVCISGCSRLSSNQREGLQRGPSMVCQGSSMGQQQHATTEVLHQPRYPLSVLFGRRTACAAPIEQSLAVSMQGSESGSDPRIDTKAGNGSERQGRP